MRLQGGKKKKKKKKPPNTPKKIAHKHKPRPKAILEYFNVDDNGKITKIKQASSYLPGCYMADHQDRYTCGRTGTTLYKLDANGKRLPPPKQNQPKKEEKKAAAAAAPAKKGKKK